MKRYMNPFDTLGATPRDTRVQLASRAQKAALLFDAAEAEAARLALTKPQTRLSAEIRWIGKDSDETRKPLDDLNREVEALRSCQRLETKQLQRLCQLFAAADAERMLAVVNADRQLSGFHEATDEAVRQARREYAREIAACLMEASAQWKTRQLSAALSQLCRECRKQETLIGNALLEETLDAYELRIAPETSPVEDRLWAFADSMLAEQAPEWLKKEYRKKKGVIHGIAQDVHTWTQLMEPLCIHEDARGMQHQRSLKMLDRLEDVYIDMVNRHRCLPEAYTLVNALYEGFSVLSQHAEWLKKERDRMKMFGSPQYRKAMKPKEPWQLSLIKWAALMLVILMVRSCALDEEPSRPNPSSEQYPLAYEQLQQELKKAEELMKATSYLRVLNLKNDIEELEGYKAETLARYADSRSPYDFALYEKLEGEIAKKENLLNLEYEKFGKRDPLQIPGLPY